MEIKKSVVFLLSVFILVSCGESNVSSDSSSVSLSHKEGLYTKMTRAISHLNESFTAKGTLQYIESDGTTTNQSSYQCKVEVDTDSYYYEERDFTTQEIVYRENYYKNSAGNLCARQLNITTNAVDVYTDTNMYDDVMANAFGFLEVQNLDGIKGQLNWYEITDFNKRSDIVLFLTGYDTSSLTVSQFAMHFDGDEFDQFRFLLEYTDDEFEDNTYYTQYLFTLDITNICETIPSVLTPYDHDDKHDLLKSAIDEIASSSNYTMDVNVNYSTEDLEDEIYTYKIDKISDYLLSSQVRKFASYNSETGDYTYTSYIKGYKNENVNGTNKLWMYYFDADTKEIIKSYDYNEYMTTSTRNLEYLLPKMGLVAPECYKYVDGNAFTSYYQTYEYCLLGLLPYDEVYTGYDFTVSVTDQGSFDKITLEADVYYQVSDIQVSQTHMTMTISYSNINTTIIDDFLINA